MKTPHLPHLARRGFCLSLLILLCASFGFAQGPAIDPSTGLPLSKEDVGVQKAWERTLAHVEFEDTTVEEAMGFVSDQFPEINFVLNGASRTEPLTLKLRAVKLQNVLDAITFATDGLVRFDRKEPRLVTVMGRSPRKQPAAELRAFNLSPCLEGLSEEESSVALKGIHQVLISGWEMLHKANADEEEFAFPDISIHDKTKLLIVVGQPAQLSAAEQVITALQARSPRGVPGASGRTGGGLPKSSDPKF